MNRLHPGLNYTLTFQEIKALLGLSGRMNIESLSTVIAEKEKIFFFDYARSALRVALMTLPASSVVGVQPFTCPTVVEAIKSAGCKIVFIDINNQLVIETNDLKKKASRLDALIVTHTFGYPIDVKSIREIMKDKIIIEDCAHAFMSTYKGEPVGREGDFAIFSFGFGKFPSAVQGGYLKVNNLHYVKAIQLKYNKISSSGIVANAKLVIKALLLSFLHKQLVYKLFTVYLKQQNTQKNNFQKNTRREKQIYKCHFTALSLLYFDLIQSEKWLQQQQQNGRRILTALKNQTQFKICQQIDGMNYFMIPVLTENPAEWINKMEKVGIEWGRHFVKSGNIMPKFGYLIGDCPMYDKLLPKILTIPCHYHYPEHLIRQIEYLFKEQKKILE